MTTNDITGDKIVSKSNTKEFRDGWEIAYGGVKHKDKARRGTDSESTGVSGAVHGSSDKEHSKAEADDSESSEDS